MTVVLNNDSDRWDGRPHKGDCCSVCGLGLQFPFLWWRGERGGTFNHIFICIDCCHKIKHGVIGDLIHINAIRELRTVSHYNDILERHPKHGPIINGTKTWDSF